MNEETWERVLEFLADTEVRLQREDAERAIGWVVLSIDDESGHVTVFGKPVWSEMEANEFAVQHHSELNRDDAEPGWSVQVLPILPL